MDEHSQSPACSNRESEPENPSIRSTPQQVFTGTQVGLPDLEAVCTGCGEAITEGQACIVYAYRPADGQEWYPTRCYCQACAPDGITSPTVGTNEALVQAWLGVVTRPHDRNHRLCLLKVELVSVSPSTDGSDP